MNTLYAMKKSTILLLLLISTSTCFSQSLFFDQLNGSTWKSEAYYNDSLIKEWEEIGLGKLQHAIDSLKVDVTLWTFKNEQLTIKHYNAYRKKATLVVKYKYKVSPEKGTLKLMLHNSEILEYKAGINANGSFVLLRRKKD